MVQPNQSTPSSKRIVMWVTILAILGVLLALSQDVLVGTLRVLMDIKFLKGFGLMLLQVALASLIGEGIGVALGALIIRSSWLTQATIRFLRIGLWIPFIVFWPLPIWSPGKVDQTDVVFWIAGLVTGVVAIFPTVALSACYYFLSARATLGLEQGAALRWVVRETILQTLLVSLIFQLWFHPYGWDWFDFPVTGSSAAGYAAVILLIAFLFLLNLTFRSRFESTAAVRGAIVTKELESRGWNALWGAVMLAVGCLILWQLFSVPLKKYFLISPPVEVLKAGHRVLLTKSNSTRTDSMQWEDIFVSPLEIFGGLVLSGVIALIVSKGSSASMIFRNVAISLFPFTNIVPIILPFFLLWWRLMGVGFWQKTVHVAVLAFFPFLQAFWGLRGRPVLCRILLAVDDALPLAFISMLFGELWGGVAGLGFFIAVTRATLRIDAALATSLLTFLLLVVLSSTLRWVAKRLYFSEGSLQTVAAG